MIGDSRSWSLAAGSSAVLVGYFWVNPLRPEHLAVLGLLLGLLLASRTTRILGVTLIPAAIFGLIYDMLHLFQARSYRAVVIEPVWQLEAWLFGWIGRESFPLGPVDVFREHNWAAVDAFGGVIYSIHLVPAFAFGLGLWWLAYRRGDVREGRRLSLFWWGFLALNLLAFCVHVLMPVAPPWYVLEHGFVRPSEAIMGNPAGLARVDALLGCGHFEGVYDRAAYDFGALPSLHVGVPAWVALRTEGKWRAIGMWLFTGVMAFYAVYFAHHYIVDLVAGAAFAGLVHVAIERTRLGDVVLAVDNRLHGILGGWDVRADDQVGAS